MIKDPVLKITVRALGKRFNREWIFRNLTHTFESENFYAITGPNGSGKSTLLQVLWGQMPPTSGDFQWQQGDETISAENIYRHIAVAAPYMDLIDEFTLEEQIQFHFRLKKVYDNYTPDEILDIIALKHVRKKQVGNFSSGMKQRLKLGLAFLTESDVLFLDEPGTNLDRQAFEWYLKMLKELNRRRVVIIASNQSSEYPSDAVMINMKEFK